MPAYSWYQKTALICGGSAGLGKSLAVELASQEVRHLILLARNPQTLDALKQELATRFPAVTIDVHPVDMSLSEEVESVARVLFERGLSIDLLIQAVGQSDRGLLQELATERLFELFSTNVLPNLNAVKHLSCLLTSGRSHIVVVGSLASYFAPRFLGGYAMAKHAIAALAQQARLELRGRNVHVMLACPGPIQREDSGQRYSLEQASRLPAGAIKPGGGAKVALLDPQQLSRDILSDVARGKRTSFYPRKAKWLQVLSAISPRLGDYLLRRRTA